MKLAIKKVTILLFLTLFVIGVYLYRLFPDKNLFLLSSLERDNMLKRDGYLRIGMIGQIYGRKIGNYYFNRYLVYSLKIVQKISIPLDPIRYFNSSKQGISSYLFFPFVVVGLIFIIRKFLLALLGYLLVSAIFTSLILPDKTIFLYFPLLFFSALVGITLSYRYLKKLSR